MTLGNDSFPSITVSSRVERNQGRLEEFAEFWKIPYTTDMAQSCDGVVISSGRVDQSGTGDNSVIISPMGSHDFEKIAADFGLGLEANETLLQVPSNRNSNVSLRANVREFTGPKLQTILEFGGRRILSRIEGSKTHLLSLDLVAEYEDRLYNRLEDAPSERFKLISKIPVPYSIVPPSLRNWSLRRAMHDQGSQEENMGSVDALRVIFLASIVTVLRRPIPRIAFWRQGKSYAMAVTHDVESRRGLEKGAKQLLDVENDLGVRSTWNIPSDRYPLSSNALRPIAEGGDIGAHDTAHDGRLILATPADKVSRVNRAKERLERLAETKVRGFRAPLLQHSSELLTAVGKAGYEYDSSVPSWEALSPTSFKPHGVGTVFPFRLNDILEIPVSLPQDHQLVEIQGMEPREAVDHTSRLRARISGLGGACILLVHPDYDFAQEDHETDYRDLIEQFRRDSSCDVMTMKQMTDWWNQRSAARIELTNGEPHIVSRQNDQRLSAGVEGLRIDFVTGYGDEGFRVEAQ